MRVEREVRRIETICPRSEIVGSVDLLHESLDGDTHFSGRIPQGGPAAIVSVQSSATVHIAYHSVVGVCLLVVSRRPRNIASRCSLVLSLKNAWPT